MSSLIRCVLGTFDALPQMIHFTHLKPLSEWAVGTAATA